MATGSGVEDTMLELARVMSRSSVRRRIHGSLADELSPTGTWLLTHLSEVGPMAMTELAQWQGVDRSTMTAQTQHLEKRGYLVREPSQRDHRVIMVGLSAMGERIAQVLRAAGRSAFGRAMGDWSPQEREMLDRLLSRLLAGLERSAQGDPG